MNSYLSLVERELKIRGYRARTIQAYLSVLKLYFDFVDFRIFGEIEEKVKNFLLHKKEQNCSSKTLHVYLSAIQFFYREFLKIPQPFEIKFARQGRKLPVILTHEEIMEIIRTLQNMKHRLIVALAYGAGLRVSEVTNLRVGDLNFQESLLYIRDSKGGRDRITFLPAKLQPELYDFVRQKDPKYFVFESQRGRQAHPGRRLKISLPFHFGYVYRKQIFALTAPPPALFLLYRPLLHR